jgi:prevent-host-death family protein
MTVLTMTAARADLTHIANQVAYGGERVCIEKNGKPVVALVSVEDMRLLEQLEDQMDLELAQKALKAGKFISFDKLKKELEL